MEFSRCIAWSLVLFEWFYRIEIIWGFRCNWSSSITLESLLYCISNFFLLSSYFDSIKIRTDMLKYRKLTKSQILKYLESIKYEYFINFTVSVFRVIIFCMQPSILLLLFRLYIAIRISNISLPLDPQYFTIPPQPHSNCISILYQFQYFIPANPIPIHFTCTTTEIPH